MAGYRNASFKHVSEHPVTTFVGADLADNGAGLRYVPCAQPEYGVAVAFEWMDDSDISAMTSAGWVFTGGDRSDSRPPP
jgi:hypothetical protein